MVREANRRLAALGVIAAAAATAATLLAETDVARTAPAVAAPATARLAPDINEPSSNVLAGARYLRQLLDHFRSSDLALAAYNAGPTAVEEAGGAPSGTVLVYVANVTALWRSLAGCR